MSKPLLPERLSLSHPAQMEPFLRNLSHVVHLCHETPCKCHSALTWVSLPWALFASSCPRTAWLQQRLGGWLWLKAQTSGLSPDSQPWHSLQKSPRLSTADFTCRINTTKSPTQTCIWTKILHCSWQRTELNLWVQICPELSGAQSTQMLSPLWLGNPSLPGQASTVPTGG